MNRYILAGAAALALALPAAAQDMAVTSDGDVYVLTDSQQVVYDAWPPERRVIYDAWPMTYQEYFWTLTPTQMDGWWVLTDEQRARVFAMTPAQRTAAWTAIAAQMASTTPTATTTATATAAAGPATLRFVSNAVVQPVEADTPPADPPICAPNQQDDCINSWEKNKTGTRPLNYWPGKPASEIATPLPAEDPND